MWMPKKKGEGGPQRFARLVGAPAMFMEEASVNHTAGSRARWKAAPPKQVREACAANTEQEASVFKRGA